MWWVVQMTSPVLRCHHISGSSKRARTVSTPSTTRRLASITGNEKTLRKAPTRVASVVCSTVSDAVLMPYRIPAHRVRQGYRVQVDRQAGLADADKRGK